MKDIKTNTSKNLRVNYFVKTKTAENHTEREIERHTENEEYVPVIIKRSDDGPRHPDDTLERVINDGLEQYTKRKISLFLSSMAAGLILGFAGLCVSLILVEHDNYGSLLNERLAMAFVYPLGFVICILSGNQLFTEHTATAVYPVLDRKVKISQMLKLWSIILVGNLVGTFLSSWLIHMSEPVIKASSGYEYLYHHLVGYQFGEVFVSAILAGWLMAQGSWLVHSSSSSTAQIICIYIVTFIIGIGGLHHSIAGSAELFVGVLNSSHASIANVISFLSAAILGNIVGGSVFVGILNYTHIKSASSEDL